MGFSPRIKIKLPWNSKSQSFFMRSIRAASYVFPIFFRVDVSPRNKSNPAFKFTLKNLKYSHLQLHFKNTKSFNLEVSDCDILLLKLENIASIEIKESAINVIRIINVGDVNIHESFIEDIGMIDISRVDFVNVCSNRIGSVGQPLVSRKKPSLEFATSVSFLRCREFRATSCALILGEMKNGKLLKLYNCLAELAKNLETETVEIEKSDIYGHIGFKVSVTFFAGKSCFHEDVAIFPRYKDEHYCYLELVFCEFKASVWIKHDGEKGQRQASSSHGFIHDCSLANLILMDMDYTQFSLSSSSLKGFESINNTASTFSILNSEFFKYPRFTGIDTIERLVIKGSFFREIPNYDPIAPEVAASVVEYKLKKQGNIFESYQFRAMARHESFYIRIANIKEPANYKGRWSDLFIHRVIMMLNGYGFKPFRPLALLIVLYSFLCVAYYNSNYEVVKGTPEWIYETKVMSSMYLSLNTILIPMRFIEGTYFKAGGMFFVIIQMLGYCASTVLWGLAIFGIKRKALPE